MPILVFVLNEFCRYVQIYIESLSIRLGRLVVSPGPPSSDLWLAIKVCYHHVVVSFSGDAGKGFDENRLALKTRSIVLESRLGEF